MVNVVILHCHFQRGGVTQVVENQVRALRDSDLVDRIFLVGGQRSDQLSNQTRESVTQIGVNDFDYDSRPPDANGLTARAEAIAADLQQRFQQHRLDPASTVLHWHNHSLGKNTAAPAVGKILASSGWRLLLQIHDFAEDNRPGNYRSLIDACGAVTKRQIDQYLYPLAPQIHYATLTRADRTALIRLGIAADRIHWLPNSVAMPTDQVPSQRDALAKVRAAMGLPVDARWSLYPVRGIRRKNVAEFLLLSRWTPSNHFAGLTLRPTTLVEARSYDRWRELARTVARRAVFDAAHHEAIRYIDNLAAAESVWSTSVAEGFGMTFLEPWLCGREVIARRLATVTDDFVESGLRFGKLYDQIPIPGSQDWVDQCHHEFLAAQDAAWNQVPVGLRPDIGDRSAPSPPIDFATLTPSRQREVLVRMHQDVGFESEIQALSGDLIQHLISPLDTEAAGWNAGVIRERYSIDRAVETLLAIYQSLLAVPVDRDIAAPDRAGTAVDVINRIRPFFPCRTETL